MAKRVEKVGVKKEKGYLYFVDKKGDISRVAMARGGKKVKFKNTGINVMHHTNEFRKMEKAFPNHKRMEKDIGNFLKWKRKPVEHKLIAAKKQKKDSKQFSLKRWLFGNQ